MWQILLELHMSAYKHELLDDDMQLFFGELKRKFTLHFVSGQNVWLETSWMTWGTMTSWCCVCWKEATSSVPTWWTGSRLLAETPTAQSPWESTSSVSRATWWASAHFCTDSTRMPTVWLKCPLLSYFILSAVIVMSPMTQSEDVWVTFCTTLWQWYLCVSLLWMWCYMRPTWRQIMNECSDDIMWLCWAIKYTLTSNVLFVLDLEVISVYEYGNLCEK